MKSFHDKVTSSSLSFLRKSLRFHLSGEKINKMIFISSVVAHDFCTVLCTGSLGRNIAEGLINLAAIGELLMRQGPEASFEFAERLDGKSSTYPLSEHKAQQVDKTLPRLPKSVSCLLSTTSCKVHLCARLHPPPPHRVT